MTLPATPRQMRPLDNGWCEVYYTQRGDVMIVLLAGGDKSTQSQDIQTAIALAKNL